MCEPNINIKAESVAKLCRATGGGPHRALERGQFRNFFLQFSLLFFCQYQIFRWLGTCLTQFRPTLYEKQDKTDIFPKPKVKNPKK